LAGLDAADVIGAEKWGEEYVGLCCSITMWTKRIRDGEAKSLPDHLIAKRPGSGVRRLLRQSELKDDGLVTYGYLIKRFRSEPCLPHTRAAIYRYILRHADTFPKRYIYDNWFVRFEKTAVEAWLRGRRIEAITAGAK
jgi:hypothetical protein